TCSATASSCRTRPRPRARRSSRSPGRSSSTCRCRSRGRGGRRVVAFTDSQRQAQEEARERTAALLREIKRIEIQSSRLVTQHLAGSYQSVFRGQGIAFAEVRAYEPGDDVRAIDWNVTARTGVP